MKTKKIVCMLVGLSLLVSAIFSQNIWNREDIIPVKYKNVANLFCISIKNGDIITASELLEYNDFADVRDEYGYNMLKLAIDNENYSTVAFLLKWGVNPNAWTERISYIFGFQRKSIIEYAFEKQDMPIIYALAENGAIFPDYLENVLKDNLLFAKNQLEQTPKNLYSERDVSIAEYLLSYYLMHKG